MQMRMQHQPHRSFRIERHCQPLGYRFATKNFDNGLVEDLDALRVDGSGISHEQLPIIKIDAGP